MQAPSENWHYIELDENQNETTKGPFTLEALKGLYQAGTINEFTFLWSDPMPTWLPLKDTEIAPRISNRTLIRNQERSGIAQPFDSPRV